MKNISINNRLIGVDQPPYIIAEAGINHEGDCQKAIELIEAAISAGADCVKFQCHMTDKEMMKCSNDNNAPIELLKKIDLSTYLMA